MQNALRYNFDVLISLTNPPRWAMTAQGPDPEITTYLVGLLAERYRHNRLSFELFPAANTIAGWGTAPDPAAYAELLKACWQKLRQMGSPATLVAAGLQPISTAPSNGDYNDLEFLAGLYKAGAATYMPVVGLRLKDLSANPMAFPGETKTSALRHYEQVREVMIKHGHRSGLIWITSFRCPAPELNSAEQQALWINQAYWMMRSQLYLGTAFLDEWNPPSANPPSDRLYIIRKNGERVWLHPALAKLAQLITLDRTGHALPDTDLNQAFLSGAGLWITKPNHP